MTPSTIQIFLMPIAFFFLFFLMLLYWGQAAFFARPKYNKLNALVFQFSILSLTLLLVLRWMESGHLPLSNLYESLIFLSWSFLMLKLVLLVYQNLSQNQKTTLFTQSDNLFSLGVVLSPMSLLTFGFAFLSLPKEMQKATALVPALQSNWLMMHVTVMILSYAALLCGSVLSIAFLVLNRLQKQRIEDAASFGNSALFSDQGFLPTTQSFYSTKFRLSSVNHELDSSRAKKSFLEDGKLDMIDVQKRIIDPKLERDLSLSIRLDNWSYRVLALGFPLLTLGILSGAVWANEAWGSYWSWDPKETWALITWLVFAIYLHTRITKGWSGEKPALVASAGFFVVWFCYLGVNLLGSGLHSYGWFSHFNL